VTITGGHMWYFGQEADGVDGVRRAVRQLVKEGADFVKIVATGGSTRTSYPSRPAFNPDEVRAIVDEAHKLGKPTAAHCASTQGVINAVEAGVDTIIHCVFLEPDGTPRFRPEVAERIAAGEAWVDFTVAQTWVRLLALEAKAERGEARSEATGRASIGHLAPLAPDRVGPLNEATPRVVTRREYAYRYRATKPGGKGAGGSASSDEKAARQSKRTAATWESVPRGRSALRRRA
jgi:hypothetical protein